MATDTAAPPKIRPLPEFAGILREQDNFATGESEGVSEQINTAFDKLMLQSGLGIAPSMLLLLCLCSGIAVAGLVFVIQENLLTTSLAAGFGFALPRFTNFCF